MIKTNVGWQCEVCAWIGHSYDGTFRHEANHSVDEYIGQRFTARAKPRDVEAEKQATLEILRDLVTPDS